ncbi:coenzyme F420-0 gamma-glutamyl ligase [Sphingobium faniae]|nr:coenzyme F420-0 gamma-glutamyl ligase [Sphingobium faniae]
MIQIVPLEGIPEISPGADIVALILAAAQQTQWALKPLDTVVIAQKIISKAEGRIVSLSSVTPSPRALELAAQCRKDARLVELVLGESTEVVRCAPDILIVRHRLGFIVANAAIDQSNVESGDDHALLLPMEPDESARRISEALSAVVGGTVSVIINDSFGRPWRRGTCGVAIGCAGVESVADLRGRPDRFGRKLLTSELAVADEIAAAASLAMGQANEGYPCVVIRGLTPSGKSLPASALLRPAHTNLFT